MAKNKVMDQADEHLDDITSEATLASPLLVANLVVQKDGHVAAQVRTATVGQDVNYVANHSPQIGKILAAKIITLHPGAPVDLAVFDPSQNPLVVAINGVPYGAAGKPGTWHYPAV